MTNDWSAWLKTHKQEAALGGAGIVVAIALYVKSKKSAAGSSSGQPVTNPTYAYPSSTADTTGYDIYNGLESQILGLQQAVLAGQQGGGTGGSGGPSKASPPTVGPAPQDWGNVVGSGYATAATNPVTGADANAYSGIPSGAIAASLVSGGHTLYYEPTAGNFSPIVPGLQPGTELYQRVGG